MLKIILAIVLFSVIVIFHELGHFLFAKKNGGSLENLSAITLELKDKHSGFNIKDYGYSRMSSFLRSIRCLTVNGNTVRLKKRREKGERR